MDGAKAFSLVGPRRARLSLSRNESVDVLRQKIDQIDAKVVNLLNDRASLAQRIGQTKSLSSQEVYVPHREKEILQRVRDLNRGPLSAQVVAAVFREIISGCRSLEEPLRVALLRSRSNLYPSGRSREIRFLSRLAIDGQHPGSLSGSQPGQSDLRRGADRELDRRRGHAYF